MLKFKTAAFCILILCSYLNSVSQCAVSSLTIRTGWDYVTGAYSPTTATDPNWIVVQDQDPLTTEPRLASVYPQGGGGFVGGVNSGPGTWYVANWPCVTYSRSCNSSTPCSQYPFYDSPIVINFTFYISSCADLNALSLDYGIFADDGAKFCLNGNFIDDVGYSPVPSCTVAALGAYFNKCGVVTNPAFFNIGVNEISFKLYNSPSGPTYFRLGAILSTSQPGVAPFLNFGCSNPGTLIAGQKFLDANGNGSWDVSETGVSNWPIELKDNFGNLVSTTTTDANGHYSFTGLPVATYQVHEGSKASYYQTFPSSKYYIVDLSTTPISTCNDFGNQACPNSGPPNLYFLVPVNACKGAIQFNAPVCANTYNWDFGDGTFASGQVVSHNFASAGTYTVSLSSPGATTFTQVITVNDCDPPQTCVNCIGSFAPDPGDYVLSLWVKEDRSPVPPSFSDAKVQVSFIGDPTVYTFGTDPLKNKVIEGWQRIEESFSIPSGATHVKLNLVNTASSGADAYFDDIRIIPKDGQMKSYVYDPVTLKLSAVLDENNYATLYEYDEEGKLVRVKKETEKGIMTVQENRESLKKE